MSPAFFPSLLCMPLLLATATVHAYPDIKVESLKKDKNSQSVTLAFWLDAAL